MAGAGAPAKLASGRGVLLWHYRREKSRCPCSGQSNVFKKRRAVGGAVFCGAGIRWTVESISPGLQTAVNRSDVIERRAVPLPSPRRSVVMRQECKAG